ncbi:MAG TPA: hypothetical protein VFJ43_12440, partial [Bacteroidia bacterium]|nr:hypothetical protein [Bacteroidia bacterium]
TVLMGVMVFLFLQCNFKIRNSPKKTTMMNIDSVLSRISSGDFIGWNGLPSDIGPEKMDAFFAMSIHKDSTFLSGSPAEERIYKDISGKELQTWFIDNKLVLIRLWKPHIKNGVNEFLKTLGNPEHKFKIEENAIYPMTTQWVYASKGITLYVNEFLKLDTADTVPDDYLQAIALYKPTTVKKYKYNLGGTETKIRLPR